jgi:SAM-dependent methyltransferase
LFNLEALNTLRSAEIDTIVGYFRPGVRILEIGAGTGRQAAEIAQRGFAIDAIEISASNYSGARIYPITDYDGRHIPFPDATFDIVFSSNVLEHVPDLSQLNRDIRRVLKPDGYCIHVMPTHVWRFWTTVSSLPAVAQYLGSSREPALPPAKAQTESRVGIWQRLRRHFGRHGERGNVISELWLFHPSWWRRAFRKDGFEIMRDEPVGIFYTGNTIFGTSAFSVKRRRRLARIFGSACHLYEVRPVRGGTSDP